MQARAAQRASAHCPVDEAAASCVRYTASAHFRRWPRPAPPAPLCPQNRAVANLFKGPNKIEEVAALLTKLERGDLKLRVRALEAERALVRVQAWQVRTPRAGGCWALGIGARSAVIGMVQGAG